MLCTETENDNMLIVRISEPDVPVGVHLAYLGEANVVS